MAYNPFDDMRAVYGAKGDWNAADAAGDKNAAAKIAADAQKYYQNLINNGYGDIADTLKSQTYAQAEDTLRSYGLIGTPYAKITAGSTLSGGDITPGVAAAGNAGTAVKQEPPDLFAQYNLNIGETRDKTNQVFDMFGQNNQAISNKNNQLWDTIYTDKGDMGNRYTRLEDFNYSNPFTTEQGRSVLERYDLAGLQGRDNQAALGGANNSGNIDSYSAANALRQQAALRNLGEQSALAAHSRTVSDGRGILGDRGNYLQGVYDNLTNSINTDISQNNSNMKNYIELITKGYMPQDQSLFENIESREGRLFNQDRTTKLDDYYIDQDTLNQGLNRDLSRADMTGNADNKTLAIQYGLMDERGNILNEKMDFNAEIKNIDKLLETETDPDKIQYLHSYRNALIYTRNQKLQLPEYAQYAKDMVGLGYMPTATPTLANKQGVDLNKYLAEVGLTGIKDTNQTNKDIAYNTNQTNKDIAFDANAKVLEGIKIQSADGKEVSLAQISSNYELGMKGYDTQLQIAINNGETQKFIQKSINENNAYIAQLDSASRNYAIGSNERIAIEGLRQEAYQFGEKLVYDNKHFGETMGYNYAVLDKTTANTSTAGTANTNVSNTSAEYKPPLTVPQVNEAIENGNLAPNVLESYQYYYGIPYETFVDANTGKINTYPIGNISQSAASGYGVDDKGWKMVQGLKKYAASNGGFLTEEEIFRFAVENSGTYGTNLDQLKKVFKYLDIDTSILDKAKNKGFLQKGITPKE